MKKYLRYSPLPISILAMIIFSQFESPPQEKAPEIKQKKSKEITTKQTLPSAQEVALVRKPAQVGQKSPVIKSLDFGKNKNQRHNMAEPQVRDDRFNGLGANIFVAPQYRAVKKNEFSPSMGDVVSETGDFTVFKPISSSDDSNANVVYDKQTGRYYPLSSVIQIKGINPETRGELLDEGFSEYYYSSPVSLMFITSSHERLFQDYKALEAKGLKVSLEVLKGRHRSH